MLDSILFLSLLAFSDLPTACGNNVHPDTIRAIIRVESNGNPLAIHDNVTHVSYAPESLETAKKIAGQLMAKGHSVDIGLMQVNSQNINKNRINYENLFDSCYNIRFATSILSDCYQRHNRAKQSPEVTLFKALSCYNTGSPYSGKEYINKILAAAGSSAKVPIKVKTNEQMFYGKGITFYRSQ